MPVAGAGELHVTGVEAVVEVLRAVFGGSEPDGVGAVGGVLHVGAAVATGERAGVGIFPVYPVAAVGEGGSGVGEVGEERVVGVVADRAGEVDDIVEGGEVEGIGVGVAVAVVGGVDDGSLFGVPGGGFAGGGGDAPEGVVVGAVLLVDGEDSAIGKNGEGGDVVIILFECGVEEGFRGEAGGEVDGGDVDIAGRGAVGGGAGDGTDDELVVIDDGARIGEPGPAAVVVEGGGGGGEGIGGEGGRGEGKGEKKRGAIGRGEHRFLSGGDRGPLDGGDGCVAAQTYSGFGKGQRENEGSM